MDRRTRRGSRARRPAMDVLEPRVTPSAFFWQGPIRGDNHWSNPANWHDFDGRNQTRAPGNGDDLYFFDSIFDQALNDDIAGNVVFRSMNFARNNGGYTVKAARPINIGSGGVTIASSSSHLIDFQATTLNIAEANLAILGSQVQFDGGSLGLTQASSAVPLADITLARQLNASTLTLNNATVTLSSASRTGGSLDVEGGSLVTLNGGALNIGDGSLSADGGSSITGVGGAVGLGNGSIAATNGGSVDLTGTSINGSGNVTFAVDDQRPQFGGQVSNFTLEQGTSVTAGGNVTKAGAGVLSIMTQGAMVYKMPVTIQRGGITVGVSTPLPAPTIVNGNLTVPANVFSSVTTLGGTGTLAIGNATPTLPSSAAEFDDYYLQGGMAIGGDSSGFSTSANTFFGTLSGRGEIRIGSPGSAGFAGLAPIDASQFAGPVAVLGGTLLAIGSIGTGPVLVEGGTLIVDGALNSRSLDVQSGAVLGGAMAIIGTRAPIRAAGDLTMEAGSTLAIQIDGATTGSGYDQISQVDHNINLDGSNLRIVPTFFPASGTVFTIAKVAASAGSQTPPTITGRFANAPEGAIVTANGVPFRVHYTTTAITLTSLFIPFASTTTLAGSASTAHLGQPVTYTATVAPAASGPGIPTPTGTVTYFDGARVLGTAPLDGSGRATLTIAPGFGTHSISARFNGDGNARYAASGPDTVRTAVTAAVASDFDGDGKADPAVYGPDPITGRQRFEYVPSSSGFDPNRPVSFDNIGRGYGSSRSIPVTADYFGDGKSAYALWTPNDVGGMTFHADSVNFSHHTDFGFGQTNDLPVVADVDGDGRSDFGVYGDLGPGLAFGFDFLLSSFNFDPRNQDVFNNAPYGYGSARAIPVVADFDGSGHAGFGLFDPNPAGSTFESFTKDTNFSISPRPVGRPTDIPTAVDITGDGRADLVLYGPGADGKNRFEVLSSSANFNPSQTIPFDNGGNGYGNGSSVPVPADYEGTGKADFAVFTPDGNGGMEFVFQRSQTGAGVTVDFASAGDIPLEAPTFLIAKKVRG